MFIFYFMYFGHIRVTVRALSTGFTRLIERRASRNGHQDRIEIDAVWISIYVSLTASRVQLRPRRDFRDYLFTAGARTRGTPHEAHEGSATPPARLPTAHDRPRTRTCTIYAENSVRAAARCPTSIRIPAGGNTNVASSRFFRFDACRPVTRFEIFERFERLRQKGSEDKDVFKSDRNLSKNSLLFVS